MSSATTFKTWWDEVGSAIRPLPNHDIEEHGERICQMAWENGEAAGRAKKKKPVPSMDGVTDEDRRLAAMYIDYFEARYSYKPTFIGKVNGFLSFDEGGRELDWHPNSLIKIIKGGES